MAPAPPPTGQGLNVILREQKDLPTTDAILNIQRF